ncbi:MULTISPECIES: hypothetical protein [Brucellaceae]|nr:MULTISPECIES: hypothetical protein [Brucella]KAB0567301.1 hypothetical protein F7Q93_20500 [Brucella pituitosa]MCH4543974.1 hypothetical protein [Ochrobactrum sp. A-1]
MKRTIAIAMSSCMLATAAIAAPAINKDYIKSLASPGKTVLVIEYYDGDGKVTARKGFASASGYKATSPTEFRVDDKTLLNLYGLEACKGEMVNRKDDFAGSCSDYAKQQLQIMLQSPKVLFCRAFVSEESAPKQNVTCYGYYNYPGSLDTVDMLEEQMLSLGALRIAKSKDGKLERPDLEKAQKIGEDGSYGMWADPRVKAQ